MKKEWYRFWKGGQPPEAANERGYFEAVAGAGGGVTTNVIGRTAARVDSPDQAMRLATVYRCTSILSGSIAALPLQLKRKKNGFFAVDEDDATNFLLTRSPNPKQTAYELIRNAVIQMVNGGNAYILPEWSAGELKSLTLLSPDSVSYDKQLDVYMVNDFINNVFCTLGSEDILHLRNMSLDGGYTGVSTIRYAAKVMSITAGTDSQSLDVFQPGASYAGFITGGNSGVKGMGEFQDEQIKTVSERVEKELQSGKKIFSLPDGTGFSALSMSPADVQLMEMKKFAVLEICRFYGVHPDMAFAGQSANYKASEMSQILFMSGTLQPILRQIEGEFNAKLIPRAVWNKYKIEFDTDELYQTDLESYAIYMEKTIQSGVFTTNYWRMRNGQPPVDGGDEVMISCNVAPINSEKINGSPILPPKNKDIKVL